MSWRVSLEDGLQGQESHESQWQHARNPPTRPESHYRGSQCGGPQVQRLMTLGLVEGAEVELAGSAIGGDPMEFRLFGCGISLRQEQARQFAVSPVAAGGD